MTSANILDMISRVKIDPLETTDDWKLWSTQMMDLLWQAKLWPYVKRTKKLPIFPDGHTITAGEQEAIETWHFEDRTALTSIRTRVGKDTIDLIINCETSADAWEKLEKNFATRGLAKILDLKRKIGNTPYTEDEDIDKWIRQMVKWREELRHLGRPIPDDEFSITLLAHLPESWRAWTDGISDDQILDADKIQGRIRERGRRIANNTGLDAALVAKTRDTTGSRGSGNPRDEGCYGCGQKGHIKRACPNRKHGKGGQSDGKKGEDGRRSSEGRKKHAKSRAMVAKDSDSDSDSSSDYAFASIESVDEEDEIALALVDARTWIADTATTSHVARELRMFSDYKETPGRTLHGAGATPILGRGTVRFTFEHAGANTTVTLRDVIHAPGVPHNLISVGRVEAGGHQVELSGGQIRFRNPKGRVYGIGKRVGNYLYEVEGHAEIPTRAESYAAAVCRPKWVPTYDEWHDILGHPGMKSVIAMHKKGLVTGMKVDESVPPSEQCDACVQGKQIVASYPKKSETEIAEIGDVTVMDTWGPASTTGIRGERYWWAFTDGKGRRSRAAFGKHKSEAFGHFKDYKAYVELKFGVKLKKIRCDNGGEFLTEEFTAYLRSEGIELETTAPKSSAQNGIAERVCRTVMDRVRTVMIAAGLPKFLWPETVAHVIYLKNRLPTRALKDKTPDEVWTGQKPDVSDLRAWGCRCWVLTSPEQRTKLDPRSKPMHFMGLAGGSKAWRYYDPTTRRIGKSRNIVFAVPKRRVQDRDDDYDYVQLPAQPLEGESSGARTRDDGGAKARSERAEATGGRGDARDRRVADDREAKADGERKSDDDTQAPEAAQDEHRPKRKAAARINYRALHETGEKVPHEEAHVLCLLTLHGTEGIAEPRNLKEAQAQPEWPEWNAAMDKEYTQLEKLGTFTRVTLPPGRRAIGCWWVYRLKKDEQGRIVRYKARLVAQGFSQVPNLDYFETFAPVVRMDSLRVLLHQENLFRRLKPVAEHCIV